jgi:ABC-2 type transport system permease protein
MQSKISFFNKTIFKKNFTHYWPVWFGYLVICLFEIPFGIYICSRNVAYYTIEAERAVERTNSYVNLMRAVMSPILPFLVAAVVAMALFSYLYNAKSANMIHSLPVRREELFVTNYLSGLLFMAVPQVIATLLGVFVCAAVGITELQYLMLSLVYALGNMFFFYSMAVCVGMLTGQLLALPVCYVALNFVEIMLEGIGSVIVSFLCFGMSNSDFSLSKFSVLSPVYYLSKKLGIGTEYLNTGGYAYHVHGGKTLLVYVLVSFVLIALALFAYRKRRIESAGDLISIGWVKPVFRWCVTICSALLGGMVFGSIFQGTVSGTKEFVITLCAILAVGVVSFFIAQMFLEKKFKVFSKKRFAELGIGAACMVVLLCMLEFDVFGIESWTPDVSEVKMASLEYNSLALTDEKEIEELIDLHKDIIGKKSELEADAAEGNATYGIAISYKLKDGSKVKRYYAVPATQEEIEDKNSVIGQAVTILERPENVMKAQFGVYYEDNVPQSGYLERYNQDVDQYDNENDLSFNAQNAKIVYEALIKDISEGNYEDAIRFQMSTDNSGYMSDQIYINAIGLQFYNKNGSYFPDDQIREEYYSDSYNERYSSQSCSAYLTIGKKCKHTIAALKEIGAITDESDLITYQDYNMRYQDVDYIE